MPFNPKKYTGYNLQIKHGFFRRRLVHETLNSENLLALYSNLFDLQNYGKG
jgi:hypothetical protein